MSLSFFFSFCISRTSLLTYLHIRHVRKTSFQAQNSEAVTDWCVMEERRPHWRCQAASGLRVERPAGLEACDVVPAQCPQDSAFRTVRVAELFSSICDVLPHLLLYTQPWPGHLVDMKKRAGGLSSNRHKSLKQFHRLDTELAVSEYVPSEHRLSSFLLI